MNQKSILTSLSALVVGCSVDTSNVERINVSDNNALGVTTIEVNQSGGSFLRVSGLDAAGHEVAAFEQRIGTIPDLDAHLPGDDDIGSEQIITIGEEKWRGISREVRFPTLSAPSSSPGYRSFFNLAEVRSVLEREHVLVPKPDAPRVGSETKYTTFGCNTADLLTSPTVAQCCESNWATGYEYAIHTFFKPVSGPNANQMVVRYSKGLGACVGLFGGSCSGADCYFGPNGFTRPQVWTDSSSYTVHTGWFAYWDDLAYQYIYDDMCTGVQGGEVWFGGTVTGTFPTSQGCPGGGTGAGQWDW